jgi:hypothetical protein
MAASSSLFQLESRFEQEKVAAVRLNFYFLVFLLTEHYIRELESMAKRTSGEDQLELM